MKSTLRRVGNSLGLTFTKDVLAVAGFSEGQELHLSVATGEIRIFGDPMIGIELSTAEAMALIEGKQDSDAGKSAVLKLRNQIQSK